MAGRSALINVMHKASLLLRGADADLVKWKICKLPARGLLILSLRQI